MEYEIDLRRYFVAVVRRWPLIVTAAIIAALLAGAWAATRATEYTATASLLMTIVETGSQLGTNEPMLSIDTIDANARRQTIAALAQSTAVETQLAPELIARVAPADYKPGMLVHGGDITVIPVGDLLNIVARGETPEQAKLLADAWTETAVAYIKSLFTDEHSDVQMASTAVLPFEAASRDIARNAVLAGVAGALLGIMIALALEFFRRPAAAPRRVESERAVGGAAHSR